MGSVFAVLFTLSEIEYGLLSTAAVWQSVDEQVQPHSAFVRLLRLRRLRPDGFLNWSPNHPIVESVALLTVV